MLRMLLALPFGVAIALGLFALMATMVTPPPNSEAGEDTLFAFDVFMSEPESEIERRDRVAPPKPDVPPPPPSMQMSAVTTTAVSAPSIQATMPDVSMDIQVEGMNINMPAIAAPIVGSPSPGFGQGNQSAMPLVRVQPSYPARALKRGIEGYVIVSFTINEEGRPTDMRVVEASPKRVFDREALRALKKWKYSPLLVDGKPVPQPGQTVKLEFTLAQ
ncbi:energy transducer TonB [Grimontia hollisae]|uniref:Protein TonB n=1 Tax=Grimontia hollisae CIP 101886 TaxID=675812 RepID=D0I977_GRIHO|nr:energy transducer TonB [Grimontia hollisae]AMG29437.1 energy transducer TonB [Grimontia hollisae]EEY71992.1 ferric siderophore transport system binding protein TonB [Grimontia hollisae CIP 101886]STO77490.1 transport protein TonB [Grimontia hollisae]